MCLQRSARGTPQAEFFYIYGWLIKIYGCFLAKPKNCGEGIFRLKTSAVYQIYGKFSAKACRANKNCNIKFQYLAKSVVQTSCNNAEQLCQKSCRCKNQLILSCKNENEMIGIP